MRFQEGDSYEITKSGNDLFAVLLLAGCGTVSGPGELAVKAPP